MNMLVLDLDGLDGRPVRAEVMIRRDTVEIRCDDRLVGICDRVHLKSWLDEPQLKWQYDDVAWLRDADGFSLAVDNLIPAWPLTASTVAGLRAWL